MSRINKPTKTNYPGLYQSKNKYGKTEYLVRFRHKGKEYSYKNLHLVANYPLHPINSVKKAKECLDWCKRKLKEGEDPFISENPDSDELTINELVDIYRDPNASQYQYNILSTYNKHVRNSLGKKQIKHVTNQLIYSFFDQLIKKYGQKSNSHFNITKNIKKVLNPIFDYAQEDDLIANNPFNTRRIKELLKVKNPVNKPSLQTRIADHSLHGLISISAKMYQSSKIYTRKASRGASNEILQLAFMWAIMTARRTSEILLVQHQDLAKHKEFTTVRARESTTKSNKADEYPIPDEIVERLPKKKKGLIFETLAYKTYQSNFRKLLDNLDVQLHNNYKLYQHDKRNLFSTIMSRRGYDSSLVDAMLSHSYDIKSRYNDVSIEDKIEVFSEYWKLMGKSELL